MKKMKRKEVIDLLVEESMQNISDHIMMGGGDDSYSDYLYYVFHDGFKGFKDFTDVELITEYNEVFGEREDFEPIDIIPEIKVPSGFSLEVVLWTADTGDGSKNLKHTGLYLVPTGVRIGDLVEEKLKEINDNYETGDYDNWNFDDDIIPYLESKGIMAVPYEDRECWY